MFPRILPQLALVAAGLFSAAACAGAGPAVPADTAGNVIAAAGAGTAQEPASLDPQRWLPMIGTSGMVSYFDQTAVRRHGEEIGVVLLRNMPSGVIKTTGGETIRSSLKRLVLNCATSMYSVVEQTLYSKRYARGESIYTIRGPQGGMPKPAATGTIAGELISRLCH